MCNIFAANADEVICKREWVHRVCPVHYFPSSPPSPFTIITLFATTVPTFALLQEFNLSWVHCAFPGTRTHRSTEIANIWPPQFSSAKYCGGRVRALTTNCPCRLNRFDVKRPRIQHISNLLSIRTSTVSITSCKIF